jgi:hypothetical protein
MTTLPAKYFSDGNTTEKYGALSTKFGKMAYGQFDPKGFGNFDPSTGIIGGNYGPYPDSSMQMTGGAASGPIVTPGGQVFKLMNTQPAPVYMPMAKPAAAATTTMSVGKSKSKTHKASHKSGSKTVKRSSSRSKRSNRMTRKSSKRRV